MFKIKKHHSLIFTKILLTLFVVGSFGFLVSQVVATSLPGAFVGSKITVGDTANTYAIADTNYLQGGHMQVADRDALCAISRERRSIGMLVTVRDDATDTTCGTGSGGTNVTYRLITNPTTDGSSGTATPTTASNWRVVIPDASSGYNGGTNKYLTADSSGNLAWGTVSGGGGGTWGSITGTLSSQTDLNNALGGKLTSTLASTALFVGNGSNVATASSSMFWDSTNSAFSVGASASAGLTNTNFLGSSAGASATGAINSNFIGYQAGYHADGSNDLVQHLSANKSNFIGYQAGYQATNSEESNFIGENAGKNASRAHQSNFIGPFAGENSTYGYNSNFLGEHAGYGATYATNSIFMGSNAGAYSGISGSYNSGNGFFSVFLGPDAGNHAGLAENSIFIGYAAGLNCFLGEGCTPSSFAAEHSIFLGDHSGFHANNANHSIFIGDFAGSSDSSTGYSIVIGNDSRSGGYENSIIIGNGTQNTASHQFMLGSGSSADFGNTNYISQLYINGVNYTWPENQAAGSGYALFNDGTGVLSWGALSNGGAPSYIIDTIDSQTKSANGAVISGASFVLQTADDTYPGLVSVDSQTFSGVKSFKNDIVLGTGSLYLNFGGADGSIGYGIRDNNGTLQFKNNAGSWADLGGGGAGYGSNVTTGHNNELLYIDGSGNMASSGFMTFSSNQLVLSNTSNQLVIGGANSATINVSGFGSSHTYSLPDVSSDANFILAPTTVSDGQILVGSTGNVPSFHSLSLSGSSGSFGLDNTGILTFPDAASSVRGLINATTQDIDGAKTFLNATTFSATSNQLVLGTTAGGSHTATINFSYSSGSGTNNDRIFTIPNTVDSNGNSVNAQFIMGNTNSVADSLFIGKDAGSSANSALNSNFFGQYAGKDATNATMSNFLGFGSGWSADSANGSNFFGTSAGGRYFYFEGGSPGFSSNYSTSTSSARHSNFFGMNAGVSAVSANNSNFLGFNTGAVSNEGNGSGGTVSTDSSNSNFLGYSTGAIFNNNGGSITSTTSYANFIGFNVGSVTNNTGSAVLVNNSYSNFFGYESGTGAYSAKNSIFIGYHAGYNDTVDNTGNNQSSNWDNSILIGDNTSTGGFENSIAIGQGATNTASNQITFGSTNSNINSMNFVGTSLSLGLVATDNTSSFSIFDNCSSGCLNGGSSPNNLFSVQDVATNFGAIATTGAFASTTSTMDEEFNVDKNQTPVNTSTGNLGDTGGFYFDTGAAPYSTPISGVNGVARFTPGTAGNSSIIFALGQAAGAYNAIYNISNLPVLQMKVLSGEDQDSVFGFIDPAVTTASYPVSHMPDEGIFFYQNNSSFNANTSWNGVVRTGGTNVGSVTCSGTMSATNFSTGRIVVKSATSVEFFIDNDASDGIKFESCGTVTGSGPSGNLTVGLMDIPDPAGTDPVYIDYIRTWQDDSASEPVLSKSVISKIASAVLPKKEDGSIIDYLTREIEKTINGLVKIQTLIVNKLTVGSSDTPAGITFYDQVTKQPYCVVVSNGQLSTTAGECGTVEQSNNSSSSSGGESQIVNDPAPDVAPEPVPAPELTPEPEPTPTPDPAPSPEPGSI